ncbi:hypothetical protein HBH71_066290 [Parastagonospora nodorum]|nr:hypothetical protein HBH71_066290 [Parastagonospora nodorum]
MAYTFSDNSCNPWSTSNPTCTLGGHVAYDQNIRSFIRNTGRDYLGKSTGDGNCPLPLAIWTHYMKDIELISIEAYTFANSHKLMVVGVNCPTVGITGGYIQGGGHGHGHVSSKYGLSADHVLDWEVVAASGGHIAANPDSHQDLLWALCGIGGARTV